MGCDIHEYYEVWDGENWTEIVFRALPDLSALSNEELDRAVAVYAAHPLELGRSYDLFTVLAGVRDYIGVQPIAPPRGLPDDLSASIRGRWRDYYYTPTWFTLAELLEFDWDRPLRDLNLTPAVVARRHDRQLRTYRDAARASAFLTRVLPYLQAQVDDPRHLRLVCWFDD